MRRLAYAGLMIAAGITGAYSESIPNFELLTLIAFASGVLLGPRDGAGVAALTMLIYSLLNPYGAAHPLVTGAQVAGEALAGLTGGWSANLAQRPAAWRAIVLGAIGAGLTAVYDLLTNVASGLVYGQMRAVLIGGIPFALWHIGTNVGLFAVVGTALLGVLVRYRERLAPVPH
jgi:hypothetical protein